MSRDRNTFRTGTSRYSTEEEVWDFLDGGEVPASFQEIWEHTESLLATSLLPGTEHSESKVSESGANQVQTGIQYPGTEDAVYDYLDRFPGNGL